MTTRGFTAGQSGDFSALAAIDFKGTTGTRLIAQQAQSLRLVAVTPRADCAPGHPQGFTDGLNGLAKVQL